MMSWPLGTTVLLILFALNVGVIGAGLRGQPDALKMPAGWGEKQTDNMIRPFDPKASWHPTYGELSYNHDGFTEDWQTEWRRGDFPTWKDMHPQAKWAEERQSDGVPSPPGR